MLTGWCWFLPCKLLHFSTQNEIWPGRKRPLLGRIIISKRLTFWELKPAPSGQNWNGLTLKTGEACFMFKGKGTYNLICWNYNPGYFHRIPIYFSILSCWNRKYWNYMLNLLQYIIFINQPADATSEFFDPTSVVYDIPIRNFGASQNAILVGLLRTRNWLVGCLMGILCNVVVWYEFHILVGWNMFFFSIYWEW